MTKQEEAFVKTLSDSALAFFGADSFIIQQGVDKGGSLIGVSLVKDGNYPRFFLEAANLKQTEITMRR